MLAPVRTVAPAGMPVSLEMAKVQLRIVERDSAGVVLPHEDDALVEGFIAAATDHLDGLSGILGLALVEQTWRQDLDGFGVCLRLPLGPVKANGIVDVKYFDLANVSQTLDAGTYQVLVDHAGRPHVVLRSGQAWPSTFARPDAVSITFKAGYGAAADVPAAIKSAILLHVGHLYENREAVNVGNAVAALPLGHAALIAPYRRVGV